MDYSPSYEEVAQELIGELTRIGHRLTPLMVTSSRGENEVLMALFHAGGSLTPGEIGSCAHVSSSRVANILRSLEEKGLVTRAHSSEDRRLVNVSLTREGRAEATARRERRLDAMAGYLRDLGDADARNLLRIVRKTGDLLEQAPREGLGGGEGA